MLIFSRWKRPSGRGLEAASTGGFGWALCVVLALGNGPVWAEPKGGQDAAMKEVLRKAQGVLRKLTEEKAALEAEKTALANDKAALESKVQRLEASLHKLEPLQALPAEVERCKASVESLLGVRSTLESQISQGREKERGLVEKQQEITAQAKDIQADNQWLVEAVKEREQWVAQCGQHNRQLLDANREIVEKYKEKGFWDEVADLEPLTGFGKIATENAAEEYRYKLHQLKVTPFQPQVPVPAAPPPQEGAAESQPAAGGAP
jgi:DNA repair exonuclease SbcCD ATPase subunit